MNPPAYFEKIRRRAADRWRQLEADAELAAPWKQLFSQVQSPRHVLSELLQNADDTGASRASASFENGVFIFEHDGEDFSEEQFESLCRFGFSNKRNLHTIGFRGVGFKSTFSLGDTVEISTPTLSLHFRRRRFTEPEWIVRGEACGTTRIEIKISDPNRAKELQRNFDEWSQNSSSLLFFSHLRELVIQRQRISKRDHGPGPIDNSRYISLSEASRRLIVIQSEPENIPEDVLAEICAERDVADLHLPPCRVEIVLGLPGVQRLFVVLPTGATIPLPFSCNAPFIQDPARYAIEDPATSPTNRWLLRRAGLLAGSTLTAWLDNGVLDLKTRAEAYQLFAEGIPDGTAALPASCAEVILDGFESEIAELPLVLTTTGELVGADESLSVPVQLHEVWSAAALTGIFGSAHQHVVAAEVSARAIKILKTRDWIQHLDPDDAINRLSLSPHPPKPPSWEQLSVLWSFVQSHSVSDWNYDKRRGLNIIPVQGKTDLFAAKDVIRLSSRRDLISEKDWDFLTAHALAVSGDWLIWLAERTPKRATPGIVDLISQLLQGLALHEPSPVDRIAARASERIFTGKEVLVADCVRVAHIFAALSARAPEGFKVVTRDLKLRELKQDVVADDTGIVDEIVPDSWLEAHLLNAAYTEKFTSCKLPQWEAWVRGESSGLHTFIPIVRQNRQVWHRDDLERLLAQRGAVKPREYFYKKGAFNLQDYGFDSALTEHWKRCATSDPEIWTRVLEGIIKAPIHHWNTKTTAAVSQEGTSHIRPLECGAVPAAWIAFLREVPCVYDLHGKPRTPAELLLRTPETEPLLNIESFVRADLDTATSKPLLKLLGVRDTPADCGKILGRLGGLAKLREANRFLGDIVRLYAALDRVVSRCAPAALKQLQETFSTEPLVLTEALEWVTTGETAIFADAELGMPGIHPAIQRLGLWPRLGVSERPALEKTLGWLRNLKPGAKLDAAAQKRVRQALQREPLQIWQSCGHWLSLEGTWEPVRRLRFRQTMQQLTKWGELSPSVRGVVADLRMLTAETILLPIFDPLRNLAEVIEYRVIQCSEAGATRGVPAWAEELTKRLCRVRLSTDEESRRVRLVAQRLHQTRWKPFHQLRVAPYVDRVPAGEPSMPHVFWQENIFYIARQRSAARLHKELADELSRPFANAEITSAIIACIEREPAFVGEYLDEQFQFDLTLPLPGLDVTPAVPKTNAPSMTTPEPTRSETVNGSNLPTEPIHPLPEASVNAEPEEAALTPAPLQENSPGLPPQVGDVPTVPPLPRPPTVPILSLIDRYAAGRGFRWDSGTEGYRHPTTGHRIAADEAPFQWLEVSNDRSPILRLWLTDQKLSRGIEVPAELWLSLKAAPASTAIVVLSEDSSLCTLTGSECLEMQEADLLSLFPSRYRIVAAP